jgi:hypothetical protein
MTGRRTQLHLELARGYAMRRQAALTVWLHHVWPAACPAHVAVR